MISVKAEVYQGLVSAFEPLGIQVFDYFPDELEQFPLIVYLEENNVPHEIVDGEEVTSHITYRVDVWASDSTTEYALMINDVFAKFGIRRITSTDAPDVSGLKHKLMKFEGIVDVKTKIVYSN